MGAHRVSAGRYVAQSPEIAARMFDGEMIIMSARDSMIFSLNEVASVIWEAADGSQRLDEIVATRVCPAFDVSHDVALADAAQLVEDLVHHGILITSDFPIASSGPQPK